MSVENLKNSLPEYAKDLKLNLSSIARTTVLNEQQLWGTLLATAAATKSASTLKEIASEAADNLSAEAYNAALGAASIMGMNNVFYRTKGYLDGKYDDLRAGLRMNIIGNPGVDKADFELWVACSVRDQRLQPLPRSSREHPPPGRCRPRGHLRSDPRRFHRRGRSHRLSKPTRSSLPHRSDHSDLSAVRRALPTVKVGRAFRALGWTDGYRGECGPGSSRTRNGKHGNPLGIVDASTVAESDRQAVAKELDYSETIFIDVPDDGASRARVQIFTPAAELPFAGHPTVGATWLAGRTGPSRERPRRSCRQCRRPPIRRFDVGTRACRNGHRNSRSIRWTRWTTSSTQIRPTTRRIIRICGHGRTSSKLPSAHACSHR